MARVTITEEMREALRVISQADHTLLAAPEADYRTTGAIRDRNHAALALARLVDEAVEQADREEARRREAEQRQRAEEWALHESYTGEEASGG